LATLQDITQRLRTAASETTGLGKTLKLDFREEGCVHIDGASVTNADLPADCTLELSKDDFEALAVGRLDPAMAMMRGKLRVRGDMAVAMKLGEMFARSRR
jgi:putative sterol carrier protein